MPRRFLGLLVCAVCLLNQTAQAQRNLKDIPDPDPEIERKSFIVADGFEVNLFAADPQIAKPIQMNFDAQGRLWIANSEVYPHIKPGEKANDRILVVEDTDGDGTAEKTTVFAGGLLIPTAVVPGDGGAYVANSTELLHLSDTDGDGKADKERVVLSGFGTEDTHHIMHTLRWGPEGRLYFNQSIYIHSHIETPWGVRRLNAGGIWQFRPETMQLDVFARGWVNSWGHHFDRYGQSFATDGAGGQGINYVIPGAAYQTARDVPKLFPGLNPGSPKYCGLEMVSGRHLPDEWQGNLLTNDFRGHRVCRFILSEDGAGFAAQEQVELIKTPHVAFRPIDIKMGPDGAIYIADWYNPIIQHGEVDFRDPRRDHVHGRIWRVSYKGRPVVKRPQLVDASVPELLDHLKSPEDWTRERARLVLKSRGAEQVIPFLVEWLARLDPKDADTEQLRLEGLWVSQSLRAFNRELLESVLVAADPRVRAAGIRVIQEWQSQLPDRLELLSRGVADVHPRVRLESVRALGNLRDASSVAIAMRALDSQVDRFLNYALWLTAWESRRVWVPRLQQGDNLFAGNARHLTFAAQAAGSAGIARSLVTLMSGDSVSDGERVEIAKSIAPIGEPADLALVFRVAQDQKSSPRHQSELLEVLADAARRRKVIPANVGNAGKSLSRFLVADAQTLSESDGLARLSADEVNVMCAAARLIGLWKVEALADDLQKLTSRPDAPSQFRSASIEGLTSLGGIQGHEKLKELSGQGPFDLRVQAVAGLARSGAPGAASIAAALMQGASPDDDPTLVVEAFLQQKNGTATLAAAVAGLPLNVDVAKLALRTVQSSGRKVPGLTKALTEAGGIKAGPKKLTPEQMQDLVTAVLETGDASAGEMVYRRAELACMKCHAIGGVGGKVGPDLVSIGGSAQVDYLINSLLNPNDKVKEGFHTVVVVTDEGKSYSGIRVRQTNADLILRDAENREFAVPLDSIDQQVNGASLMPSGLTERLTRQELVDVVRFMSELGKVGGIRIGLEPVVRHWEVLLPTPEAAYALRRTRLGSVTEDNPAWQWRPVYSRVDGQLPLHDLPKMPLRVSSAQKPAPIVVLRFDLNLEKDESVQLEINSTDGLTIWSDGAPIEPASLLKLDLSEGKHRITIAVNHSVRKEALRILQLP